LFSLSFSACSSGTIYVDFEDAAVEEADQEMSDQESNDGGENDIESQEELAEETTEQDQELPNEEIDHEESDVSQCLISNPYQDIDFNNYYKSNLHMHSNQSDGDLSVADLVYSYCAHAYDILAITDHDTYPDPPDPPTTWPWTNWITEEPTVINTITSGMQTSAYYPDLSSGGVLAVRGNELTGCQSDTNTHVGSLLTDLGYANCPTEGFNTYLQDIENLDGLAVFNHPGRHDQDANGYNEYFDVFSKTVIGVEIHNYGAYDPIQDSRVLWDSVNAAREYDDLIWGFSNDDFHHSEPFRNYNRHYMTELTVNAFRTNITEGAFTASYEITGTGDALTPLLTGVTIEGSTISITCLNCDSVEWYDNSHTIIATTYSIDACAYATNFVRVVLHNQYGMTYTQPFGIR
jgi:hypothetical protein